jgi:3-isopropylmalate/(R)-2-methylmalate dehydratase small subunit
MAVFKYGDDINTDLLFPGRYTYTCAKADEIIPHLLEDLDPEFSKKVKKGDIIIAGENFGCGSSREQPALGLKAVGIEAIIAKSFARIFFRAAINQGLILIECRDAVDYYEEGKEVKIDLEKGKVKVGDKEFAFPPLSKELLEIRDSGGLLNYTRKKLEKRGN